MGFFCFSRTKIRTLTGVRKGPTKTWQSKTSFRQNLFNVNVLLKKNWPNLEFVLIQTNNLWTEVCYVGSKIESFTPMKYFAVSFTRNVYAYAVHSRKKSSFGIDSKIFFSFLPSGLLSHIYPLQSVVFEIGCRANSLLHCVPCIQFKANPHFQFFRQLGDRFFQCYVQNCLRCDENVRSHSVVWIVC